MFSKRREKVVEELTRGRELAVRLKELLAASSGDGGMLAKEVVGCFSRALSALDQAESSEVCQGMSSTSSDETKSSAAKSGKRKKPRLAGGGRRLQQLSQKRTVTSATLEDGATWRKYGQKPIYGAVHPRSYFRCTHKHDQGCQAKRTVQRAAEDPTSFLITYAGHHSCKSTVRRIPVAGSGEHGGAAFLIHFGSEEDFAGSSSLAPPQRGLDDEDADDVSNISLNDSSSDFYLLPELSPVPETVMPQFADDVFTLDPLLFNFS